MSWINEFVKESLPTPLSKWAGIATLSTTASSLWLPEFLQKIGLHLEGTETLSFRLAVVSTILSFGSLITLSAVVRAYRNQERRHAQEIHPSETSTKPDTKKRLEKAKEDIVLLLASSKFQTEPNIAKVLGVGEQLAIFYLNELFSAGYITNTLSLSGDPIQWSIHQNGRAYLVEHSLLK